MFNRQRLQCLEGEDSKYPSYSAHGSTSSNKTSEVKEFDGIGIEKPWFRERILGTVSGEMEGLRSYTLHPTSTKKERKEGKITIIFADSKGKSGSSRFFSGTPLG